MTSNTESTTDSLDSSPSEDPASENAGTRSDAQSTDGTSSEQAADAAGDASSNSVEALQLRVSVLEDENRKLKGDYLRALAEAENARRMADKRIDDNSKYALSNFAGALLSVADNLGRALLAAPPQLRENNEALKNLAVGVELTERELQGTLAKYQVSKIDALGKAFDPNLHQAVQEADDPSVPAGTVVQVYQDGYTIHDRLLRPTMVVVSRGGPKREAELQKPEAETDGSSFGGRA